VQVDELRELLEIEFGELREQPPAALLRQIAPEPKHVVLAGVGGAAAQDLLIGKFWRHGVPLVPLAGDLPTAPSAFIRMIPCRTASRLP
jgi:hypothetical protein